MARKGLLLSSLGLALLGLPACRTTAPIDHDLPVMGSATGLGAKGGEVQSPYGVRSPHDPAPDPPARFPGAPEEQAPTGKSPRLEVIKIVPPSVPIKEDPALVAALRCFLEHRPADAVAILDRFDKANQDLLLGLLPLLAHLSEDSLENCDPKELGVFVEQLHSVLEPLRPKAALTIEQLCFCKAIRMFGDYDPVPADHPFRRGEYVQVYVELRNFSCVQNERIYATRLGCSLTIRNFAGQVVWRSKDAAFTETCRTQRHDFFIKFPFRMDVPPGDYTLVVRLLDNPGEPSQRSAERTLDFRVTAMPQSPPR